SWVPTKVYFPKHPTPRLFCPTVCDGLTVFPYSKTKMLFLPIFSTDTFNIVRVCMFSTTAWSTKAAVVRKVALSSSCSLKVNSILLYITNNSLYTFRKLQKNWSFPKQEQSGINCGKPISFEKNDLLQPH